MTTLVVHAGSHLTGWDALHRHLVASRDALQTQGVQLLSNDAPPRWHGIARALTQSDGAFLERLRPLAQKASKAGSEFVLLSSPAFADALRTRAGLDRLLHAAAATGMSVRVVAIVRDQLGYLNQMYVHRVISLATAASFEQFVEDPQPSYRLDYDELFAAVTEARGVDFAAVPYSHLASAAPAAVVLAAAGLRVDLPPPPDDSHSDLAAGPALVAAARVLNHRVAARGSLTPVSGDQRANAAHRLRRYAKRHKWDTTAYWGWTPALTAAAAERYGPRNDAFAARAWGTTWPEPTPDIPPTAGGLSTMHPRIVTDVMDTVDRLAKSTAPRSTAAG